MSLTERLSALGLTGPVERKQLRSFGLLVGAIFCLIGVWPAIVRGQGLRTWAFVLGGALVLLGSVLPASLGAIYRVWMLVGHVLGWINTRIVLGMVFFLLVTPIGWVMRMTGRDPMRRRFDSSAQTYRVWRTARPRTHMARQF